MKIIQIGMFPIQSDCIRGGVEASVYGICKEQAKTHSVIAMDMPRNHYSSDVSEIIDGIAVKRFAHKSKNNLGMIKQVLKYKNFIINEKPTICHIHTTSLFSFLLYLLLKRANIPVLITVHGIQHVEQKNVYDKNKSLRNLLKYLVYSLTELFFLISTKNIIVDTPYVTKQVTKFINSFKIFSVPKCYEIPQGIDDVFFRLENKTKQSNQVLVVGGFAPRKGYLELLSAIALAKKDIPDIKVYCCGYVNNAEYYDLMKTRLLSLNLTQNVFFMEALPLQNVLNYYASSTVFALHSQEESQGIVFCEAMATGLPIIATNVGGVPDVVKDNVNGFLSNYDDTKLFALNLVTVLKNEDEQNRIFLNNKKDALQYSWEVIAQKIGNVYKLIQ